MPALQVHLYSMHGQQLAGQFSLGSEAAKEGVLDCIIYGDGLVALTGTASIQQYPPKQSLLAHVSAARHG